MISKFLIPRQLMIVYLFTLKLVVINLLKQKKKIFPQIWCICINANLDGG